MVNSCHEEKLYMTCNNERHDAYSQAAHSTVHEIAAEAACAGLQYGRELSQDQLDQAAFDANEAMALNPAVATECTRMLTLIVRAQRPVSISA